MGLRGRQAFYQGQNRIPLRESELLKVRDLVIGIRIEIPRIGTSKLYHILCDQFSQKEIKIGRDAFFDYLRRE